MENRRRKYIVKEGDHWGIMKLALFMIVVLAVLISGLFYVLADKNLEGATYRAHFNALRHTMQMLLPWLILVDLIGLVIVAIMAIFLTHSIAGPSYHLIRDIKNFGDGDLTIRTKFRKHDRLKAVGEAFSESSEKMHAKIVKLRKEINNITSVSGNNPEIKTRLDGINKILDDFKI
jgi:methyl-accepting chemotaxis protein